MFVCCEFTFVLVFVWSYCLLFCSGCGVGSVGGFVVCLLLDWLDSVLCVVCFVIM